LVLKLDDAGRRCRDLSGLSQLALLPGGQPRWTAEADRLQEPPHPRLRAGNDPFMISDRSPDAVIVGLANQAPRI